MIRTPPLVPRLNPGPVRRYAEAPQGMCPSGQCDAGPTLQRGYTRGGE